MDCGGGEMRLVVPIIGINGVVLPIFGEVDPSYVLIGRLSMPHSSASIMAAHRSTTALEANYWCENSQNHCNTTCKLTNFNCCSRRAGSSAVSLKVDYLDSESS